MRMLRLKIGAVYATTTTTLQPQQIPNPLGIQALARPTRHLHRHPVGSLAGLGRHLDAKPPEVDPLYRRTYPGGSPRLGEE